ncbi:MAG: hypothetical protein MI742_07440 [Desulfobacterales bacterium]|nr:hypothetical protein [Desulfobacterales bacterium]
MPQHRHMRFAISQKQLSALKVTTGAGPVVSRAERFACETIKEKAGNTPGTGSSLL